MTACQCPLCHGHDREATRTRCRHCYADIIQLMPNGRWRDVEDEAATCQKHLWHEPLPKVTA